MKRLNFWLLAIVLPVVVILLIGGIILYNLIDVNLNDLNGKGQVVSTIESPNNNYVAEIRLIDENGNATTPIQQAVSVSSNASNQNQLKEETVYWEIHSDSETPEVNWLDEDTINVNGKIIDVLDKDTYYNWQDHSEN
ncbi:hypothetical protein CHH91_04265 [Virgibacillus sp. 7505]|uniref:DUF5412 family protein n=1 Tax=Virgibacillus sp. 7505 TaxID=2022548 RepID=UPI000BA54600|nr:DUF5412 family protein [Virgibacillus sp. 7505]PAE17362.1 hypothetical protein CHH91_04265 [Virgibacillus sp. 7505]